MKTKTFIIAATLAFTGLSSANATIITVSNNANSPGQYTDLQTAIDAASNGDTILVSGSLTSYGNISINKSLVFIGAGYNNPYGENTIINYIYLERVNAAIGADNSVIKGFQITNTLYFFPSFTGGNSSNQILSNITIERCKIYQVFFYTNSDNYSYQDITIQNCLLSGSAPLRFTGSISFGIYSIYTNLIIRNNIFDNIRFQSYYFDPTRYYDLSGVTITNNVFINETGNVFAYGNNYRVANAVVQNNIFYAADPQSCIGCTFNNNITYLNNNDTLVGSSTNPGSIGSGNIIGSDPLFINFPFGGEPFSYTHDYHLQGGSPGINAGTDGSNIGIYGGSMPYEVGVNPNIPQMEFVTFPGSSSVGVGGTLNFDFKSLKQD